MQVRYRYRLYPSPGQQQALARVFGCARVVYNDCLRLRDACHAAGGRSPIEVQRRVVTLAKQAPERAWLGEVASVALVQASTMPAAPTGTGSIPCPARGRAARWGIRCPGASTSANRSG